ncbi:MAG: VOC family protein [Bryobacteraceae bacterium]
MPITGLPGLQGIDHVAIAVPAGSLDAQVRAWAALGFQEIHREEVLGRDQVREALLRVGNSGNLIQLIEPLTPDSPVQRFLDCTGGRGGLAHIAFRVESAQRAYEYLQARGYRLLDPAPRPGSRGTQVFFLHPKSHEEAPLGVLIEVVEDSDMAAAKN